MHVHILLIYVCMYIVSYSVKNGYVICVYKCVFGYTYVEPYMYLRVCVSFECLLHTCICLYNFSIHYIIIHYVVLCNITLLLILGNFLNILISYQ